MDAMMLLAASCGIVLSNWLILAFMFNWYHEKFVLPTLAVRSHQDAPQSAAPLDFAPPSTKPHSYGSRAQLTEDMANSAEALFSKLDRSF